MWNIQSFPEFLQKSFAERTERNRSYSLRSFARDLDVSPGQLSLWLNGKKGASAKTAQMVAKKLGLNNEETDALILLVEAESSRSEVRRKIAQKKILEKTHANKAQNLSLDLFQAISEWQHYAILELASLPGFKADSAWISARLDISKIEAEVSLARLKKLDLIVETNKGFAPAHEVSISPSGIPSGAIRKHHHQILQKADHALEFIPLEERDFASTTLTFDIAEIEEAREMLKDFRRSFANRFGTKKTKGRRVFALGSYFFPIDKGDIK